MIFATYRNKQGEELVGLVSRARDRVTALRDLGHDFATMIDLIAAYDDKLAADIKAKAGTAPGVPLAEVELQAPIPHPKHDILCAGQNYVAHALEASRYRGITWEKPEFPIYFSKRVDRAPGPDAVIPAHADITQKLDYEVELAVVIGRTCSKVKPEEVFDHIFGYTVANDISARDIQMNHVQWSFGKGLDGFAPMGPWIVTRDEFAAPPHLAVKTRVNGETRQDSNTNDFIFDIPFMVSQLSGGMTLEPGDIIITGTPSGVGLGFQPPRFLKSGDVVECEVEGIGVLRNTIK